MNGDNPVRALVLEHGWNSTAYQILSPGIAHWIANDGDACAGFVRHGRHWVVAGAPVCALERLPAVVAELEAAAARDGCGVCYFAAEARLERVCAGRRTHSRVSLGAQPVWRPAAWATVLARHASLRAQLNRARNKGVSVSEWTAERATSDPALARCLAEWLDTRGLPPLHFLVEPHTLATLGDRRVFVAERGGGPVAFLVAAPVPRRRGWLTEQFVRGQDAPNGTAELMIAEAIGRFAAEGAEYVTMGLAPLSRHSPPDETSNPLWLRLSLSWVRAHGRRFYNFDGLDAFKAKFAPEHWEPVYAITNRRRFSPLTLWAIAAAFSAGSPIALVVRAVGDALHQEFRWLGRRRRAVRP